MVNLKIVFVFLNYFTTAIYGDSFVFEAIEALSNQASSLAAAAAAALPQLNPMRMLEEGPIEPCPIVKTDMGSIKGLAEFSRDKKVFFSYYAIPYSKPPLGSLRFESPKPWDEPWESTRDATEYSSPCIQFDMVMAGGIYGSEDCLYLNVFTKSVDPEKKYPVIIYLHGGLTGMEGDSKRYHPKYFMDNDGLVFVTLNYRLGALGFLNSGEGTVKGNMGLKDQQVAMKWVQKNIKLFSGNPQQITLIGDSAGAVSAHFHALSESSKGLFNRAILQSGHALSPSGFTPGHYAQFRRFADNFDCPQEDIPKWLACMKNIDATEIVRVHTSVEHPIHSPLDSFTVTMEKPEEGSIVTANPFAIFESGNFSKIPIIFGVNEADGAGLTSRIEAHDEIKKTLEISWATYIPIILRYMDNPKVSSALKRHYYPPGQEGPENDLTPLMQMITDADFLYPLHQVLRYYRNIEAEVYMYYYSYKGQLSRYPAFKSYKKDSYVKGRLSIAKTLASDLWSQATGDGSASNGWGPVLGDQLLTLFYSSTALEIMKASADYEMSKTFLTGLTEFIKDNKNLTISGVVWPRIKKEGNIEAMTIDKVCNVTSNHFHIVPFLDGLHIRDPPPQFLKPVPSELKRGDI